MRQTRHDFRLDVLLYVFPLLPFFRRTFWQEFAKVARLDIGYDATVMYSIKIINYCVTVSEVMYGRLDIWEGLLSSTAECAAFRNSSGFMLGRK